MEVALHLRTLKLGVSDEHSTATRRPCVAVFSKNAKVRSVLSRNHIRILAFGDEHILIEPPDIEMARNVLTAAKFVIKEDVDQHLLDVISYFEVTPVSEEEIASRLGELWHRLRPFQRDDVRFAVERKSAYFAMEMGLGKTLSFLATALFWKQDWPFLVGCPRGLAGTWKNQIVEWLGTAIRVVIIRSSKQFLKPIPDHDALIVSYSLIAKPMTVAFLIGKYKIMVCDESHKLKTRDASCTLAVLQMAPTIKHLILMSGTPFDYPAQMYSQIKILFPEIYPVFFKSAEEGFQYGRQYCNPTRFRIGNVTKWEFNGYENQDELGAMLTLFLIRQTKNEVLKFLPAKIRSCVVLEELSPAQYAEIELQKNKDVKLWGPDQIEVKSFDYMDSFRLTCNFKIPQVLHFLKTTVIDEMLTQDPSLQVLVFCHNSQMREDVVALLDANKVRQFCIYGKTKQEDRDKYQLAFQTTNDYSVAVLSITACGTGLTLTRASVVIFTEIMFSPSVMMQAEDRAHRLGQQKSVHIFYLVAPKTTDDTNWHLIRKKEREMTNIIDGEARELRGHRVSIREVTLDATVLGKRKQMEQDVTPRRFVTRRIVEMRESAK